MADLKTLIFLQPGPLSVSAVHDVLRLCLEEFRWFKPSRYGNALTPHRLTAKAPWLDTVTQFYEQEQRLCVAAGSQQLFFLPDRPGERSYSGSISWFRKKEVAGSHAAQVVEVMSRVGSPLAVAALEEDLSRKHDRWVRAEVGRVLEFTVTDYSEGLAGVFWRNFYGTPFTRLFGERLASLPSPDQARRLEHGVWLVQPYELPQQAGSDAARAAEAEIVAHLGRECFYDHDAERKPTRRPEVPSL